MKGFSHLLLDLLHETDESENSFSFDDASGFSACDGAH